MQRTVIAAIAAIPLAAAAFAFPAPVEGVEPGDKVEYSFRNPIVGALGQSDMSDFLGKPVLIEFWGTR
ncbi:hypothetical protein [Engelhardtia mirabilis]|uniref:Uncharacterized protein n=1 Tax=Engelhardtia mirabilis TaxID=2528011 RepID=A0A518BLF7_9BACT|nr:hypothetical protein Pla133_28990 [Planctomycetes bacterium Pla133]QDV02136.1 hypothetical protein Pla86_28980 [Planctomycetes bacterium Pla86]